MYLGRTGDLRARLQQHVLSEHPEMTHARWLATDNEEDARHLEDAYLGVDAIRALLPWNKVGASDQRGRSELEVSGGLPGLGRTGRRSRWPFFMLQARR
jgi:hypothetical protein